MTQGELDVIRNVIRRLRCEPKMVNGEPFQMESDEVREALRGGAARLYLDSWVIGALVCLLPESRNVKLAVSLSK